MLSSSEFLLSSLRCRVYEPDDGMNQVRAGRRIKVEFLIQEAMAFDVQLSNLISRRIRGNDGLKHVMTLRCDIASCRCLNTLEARMNNISFLFKQAY